MGGPTTDGNWALVPVTRELWVKPDGSGRLIETRGEPTWFGPADKAAWVAAGSPDLGGKHAHGHELRDDAGGRDARNATGLAG